MARRPDAVMTHVARAAAWIMAGVVLATILPAPIVLIAGISAAYLLLHRAATGGLL